MTKSDLLLNRCRQKKGKYHSVVMHFFQNVKMYGTSVVRFLNNLHLYAFLDIFWRVLQLSEIILKEGTRKEGRKFIGAVVKIKFVCSAVDDESGLCLEMSGFCGYFPKMWYWIRLRWSTLTYRFWIGLKKMRKYDLFTSSLTSMKEKLVFQHHILLQIHV